MEIPGVRTLKGTAGILQISTENISATTPADFLLRIPSVQDQVLRIVEDKKSEKGIGLVSY